MSARATDRAVAAADNLPPRQRSYRRADKAAILAAIRAGTISEADAWSRFGLDAGRLAAWRATQPIGREAGR